MTPGTVDEPRSGGLAAQQTTAARGRRVAMAVYFGVVGLIGAAAVVQLTRQVFFAPLPPGPIPFATCQEGLQTLLTAIDRGRHAAEQGIGEDRVGSEEAALLRFRTVVGPAFAHRDALRDLCGARRRAALDAVERLRYSEEHGVRHQATELARLRGRARRLVYGEPSRH